MGPVRVPMGARWPAATPTTATTALERLAAHGISRPVLALCLLWLVAVGPIVTDMSAQPAPRFALTGALVDDGAIVIDGYRLGVDKAERDGHLYSDKAPGQEVLAVPAYVAARAVGAEPARVDRVESNLTLWWVTFWSAVLPGVGIILLVAVAGHRRGTPVPVAALATLAFGTMLLPFSVNLYGHVLAALLGFAAWLVIDRRPSTIGRALVAGGLVGVAVLVEYQMAIVALALVALLVVRRSWTGLVAFAAAGLPSAVALGAYQAAAFGSPWSSGYGGKDAHQGATLLVTGIPRPRQRAVDAGGTPRPVPLHPRGPARPGGAGPAVARDPGQRRRGRPGGGGGLPAAAGGMAEPLRR